MNATIQVRRSGVVSEVRSAAIGQVSPGIFIMDQNTAPAPYRTRHPPW
jgi:hypothetical protein